MINHYFYEKQISTYLRQFAAIFYGLEVETGIGECNVAERISVPIVIGHKDRVVAAIMAGNTQNRVFSLPTMSFNLTGLALAPERRKDTSLIDQRATLRVGGVFPDDLTAVKRVQPIPYDMTLSLSIWASNTDQMNQILEQILILFNPDIQLQKSDAPFDWTRLTRVELQDISNESNMPSDTDRRIVMWTLTFLMPIFIGLPIAVKDDLVRKIIIKIGDLNRMTLNEVGEDGNLQPFGDELARVEITERDPEGPEPFPPVKL